MSIQNDGVAPPKGGLEKARNLSHALYDAARKARMSKRGRNAYTGGGIRARRGQAAVRWATAISFVLIVALPSIAAAVYYAFIAADQYEAEAQFTVHGGEVPVIDGLGSVTGFPSLSIIQDTLIVTNYIESRAAVEKLEATAHIRDLYSRKSADFLARFDPSEPIERFVKYWNSMVNASIKMPAGIVVLHVRAFDPQDAATIASAAVTACEDLVNGLNDRMYQDAVRNAEQELDRTSNRLGVARVALEKARNDTELLDADKAGEALNKLITETRSVLLRLQQEYTTQLRSVSAQAPQMVNLKSRIDATNAQIAELRSKLTQTAGATSDSGTISSSMTKFAELTLEEQTAERLYSGAIASLELARLTAEHKRMYLNTFVTPLAPEEARYPRRLLYSVFVVLGSLAVWGALAGIALVIRNHKA